MEHTSDTFTSQSILRVTTLALLYCLIIAQ
ncbi:hypothetical protein DJ90_6394 [Paenibacillus macerans]|uniref:Uncharacterized protein n=1 Tax=Paenibacillus macerans TaxID=44252 RepID=A0A090ZLB7_PAEMA|nr:hypothetical protein DJ90_6394 [Paenibacillus macerans]